MPSPFPGMDPWLEDPRLWPDFHNRLIAALGRVLGPVVRPRYFVALEERLYTGDAPGLELVPLRETFLEVRGVEGGDVVTVVELLSPANKRPGEGRQLYLRKRSSILTSFTSLLEIDLLRAGERMPLAGAPATDYAVLVSRAWQRPRADLLPFGVRDQLPALPVPLREGDDEPVIDLAALVVSLYAEASYDLRLDYQRPPATSLRSDDADWAGVRVREHVSRG